MGCKTSWPTVASAFSPSEGVARRGSLGELLLVFFAMAFWTPAACGQEVLCDCERPSPLHRRTLLAWPGSSPFEPTERYGKFKDETILTDRPDFTESSTTVGRNVVQIECGYTYFRDRSNGQTAKSHSFPESLFRVGLGADWFELRFAFNWAIQDIDDDVTSGAEDLYAGTKLALFHQKGWLPEVALILQTTIPIGDVLSADELLPGFNLLYGWDVTDGISFAGSTQINRAASESAVFRGDPDQPGIVIPGESKKYYGEFAQSLTIGYSLAEKLGAYTEWFVFSPMNAGSEVAVEHYANGGFTYLVTDNFQLDIRVGVGLSEAADDFFTGIGASVRF